MSRVAMSGGQERWIIAVLAGVALLTATDVVVDLILGSTLLHITVETTVILSATLALLVLWRHTISGYRERLRQSEAGSERWRSDAERWRGEAAQLLRGLAEAIDRQFETWGLSESEREVGFLLLKGLSLKEIAEVRGVAERTVRKQSLAVYRKSDLGGRAELAAYFLEDLLPP